LQRQQKASRVQPGIQPQKVVVSVPPRLSSRQRASAPSSPRTRNSPSATQVTRQLYGNSVRGASIVAADNSSTVTQNVPTQPTLQHRAGRGRGRGHVRSMSVHDRDQLPYRPMPLLVPDILSAPQVHGNARQDEQRSTK
jgi:hypothetical protein